MQRMMLYLTIVAVLALLIPQVAMAEHGEDPIAGCPDNFMLHHVHEPHAGHQHHHVGNDKDLNGDGYFCVKHVGKNGNHHVHIDNNVPCEVAASGCDPMPHNHGSGGHGG